jgi:hypothetical protein
MTPERSGRKPSIAELGPAWITAIATLLGALVAVAGFLFIRAATPSAPTAMPTRSSEPPANGPSTAPVSTQPTTLVATPGRALTQFNVDLPGGYGLTFGASPTRPVRIDSGAELLLSWNNGFYTPDRHGTLATLDSSAPSYADCVASARFTSSVIFPKPGTVFCYLGHDLVVGIKIVKSLFGEYDTLDITVWQAPQSPNG